MSFELIWKVIKGYLDAEGYSTKSPGESMVVMYLRRLLEQIPDINGVLEITLSSYL